MKHFDLGRHTRHISTRSTEAQRWFDLGLNWSFGFNHEDRRARRIGEHAPIALIGQTLSTVCSFRPHRLGGDTGAVKAFAQTAEDLSYDHIVIYDHVLGAVHAGREPKLTGPYKENDPFHEPLVTYAYLAGVTKNLGLTTGVIILPQRQTAFFAKQAADVDRFSDGRLRLGVGVGWNWVEYDGLEMSGHFRCRGKVGEGVDRRSWWCQPRVGRRAALGLGVSVVLAPRFVRAQADPARERPKESDLLVAVGGTAASEPLRPDVGLPSSGRSSNAPAITRLTIPRKGPRSSVGPRLADCRRCHSKSSTTGSSSRSPLPAGPGSNRCNPK